MKIHKIKMKRIASLLHQELIHLSSQPCYTPFAVTVTKKKTDIILID